MSKLKQNDIVTVEFENLASSNTFIVDSLEDDTETVLLKHPLFEDCLVRYPLSGVNVVGSNIKDSTERGLDFARTNKKYLDFYTVADLEALCLYFVVRRQLTPRQKQTLSAIRGTIASARFNNDIKAAMDFVVKNEGVLDEFNLMWYRNFNKLFTGEQPITSGKQRAAIFNIAGFAMAELATPTTDKR